MEEKDLLEFFRHNDDIIEIIESRLSPSAHPLHRIFIPSFKASDRWDPPMPALIGPYGAQWDCALCGVWTDFQNPGWLHFSDHHLCPDCQNLLIKNSEDIRGRDALKLSIETR